MKKIIQHYQPILGLLFALSMSGCATSMDPVPLKVFSDPQGGYVLMKVDQGNESDSPWIYLGTTPLETTYAFDKNSVDSADKISFRILKEGYFDQTKDWSVEKFKEDAKNRNMIYWNPNLAEMKKP